LWKVDEIYIKVKGKLKYFHRAVDSDGDTIDFMLSSKRDVKTEKRFFKKALSSYHNQIPKVITVDKNPAYPPAIDELKNEENLFENVEIRQTRYLNNIIEQEHRYIK
jgi:IS6 family transposase